MCACCQNKSSCYSPNFVEQTAHCDHKPRAAWVHLLSKRVELLVLGTQKSKEIQEHAQMPPPPGGLMGQGTEGNENTQKKISYTALRNPHWPID